MSNLLIALALAAVVSLQPDVQGALQEAARLEQAGKTAAALESYQSALEAAHPGSRGRGTVLLALAALESDMGRYGDAKRHAGEAAAVFRAIVDTAGLANALNRSGLASLYEGKYDDAGRDFRAALDASRKAGDAEGEAEHLSNLANVHFFLGRYAEAADRYADALRLTTAAAGKPWARRRRRLLRVNQATLYQRLGRDQEALDVYRELGSPGGDLRPSEQAQVLANLGVLYRRLGDPIKALATYDQARAMFARDRHTDGELGVLKNRGIVLALDLARFRDAEQTFSEALAIATSTGNQREVLHAHLYRAETRLRAGDRSGARDDFHAGLALARALQTPEEEWKALYGLGRVEPGDVALAHLSDAVSVIEHIREQIRVPSLRSEFLNDKREVYDTLIAARLRRGAPGELFNLLERSHSRGWRERLELAGSIELTSVQKVLPDRVLLLDYWNAAPGSAVVAVSRERSAILPLAVNPADIRRLIDTVARPAPGWRDLAARVALQMLPPESWFENIAHVVVVPDGAVALVPFEVLPTGGRLLVERAAVSYTPTAATLLRAPPTPAGLRPPWHLQLEAFADPVFASATLDDAARLRGRLVASGDEVRLVARELGGRSVLHVGVNDRKAHLFQSGPRAPLLHLATHAMADADAMEQSRLLFSSAEGTGGPADYLFLKEAYDLPLGGVELAVLSACDTERGRLVRGEGVQSFSRAFLAAGARTTVTTLWRVADEPTADFMAVFYHHLQGGVPRDEALRRAKLRFLSSGSAQSAPHFWASFVLTGDALHPIPRAIAWTTVMLWTALALAVFLALLALRRLRRTAPAR